MPTILSITSKEKQGMWPSLFHRKKVIVTDHQIQRSSIRLICYQSNQRRIPWKAICAEISEEDKKHVLCPASLHIPQETGLRRFEPSYYGAAMAQNAFFSLLNMARVPPRDLRLALYDPCARYFQTAKQMMSYCAQLWIFTENPIGYQKVIQEMVEEFGGEPLLTDEIENIRDCHAILSPGRWMSAQKGAEQPILFSGYPPMASFHGLVFWRYHMNLPREYRNICPLSLENFYFLAALYELCGLHALGRLVPDSCLSGGEEYSIKRLAGILQKTAK